MSKATIDQSLCFLEEKDFIYRNEKAEIKILDPLIKFILSKEAVNENS